VSPASTAASSPGPTPPRERFFLEDTYPAERMVHTGRLPDTGVAFSNVNAAVRRDLLLRFPFRENLVMSEDQAWALAVLEAGWEVRYEPAAAVYHGHRFGLVRAFRRNFDSGSSLARLGLGGAAWRAGFRHLAQELRWVGKRYGALAIPGTLAYEAARMAGYQLGRLEPRLPQAVARRLGEAPRP